MASDENLISLIGKTAFDPSLWETVLPSLAELGGGWGAQLIGSHTTDLPTGAAYHLSNFDAGKLSDWIELGGLESARNPRARIFLKSPSSEIFADRDLAGEQEIRRNPLYQTIYAEVDVPHAAIGLFGKSHGVNHTLTVCRSNTQGAVDNMSKARLSGVLPHLMAAIELRQWLEIAGVKIRTDTLEAVGVPSALVDHRGRIVYLNSAAEAVLKTTTRIYVRDGKLCAQSLDVERSIETAIARATSPFGRLRNNGGVSRFTLPVEPEGGMTLRIAPLPDEPYGLNTGGVAILIFDPSQGSRAPTGRTFQQFGLSRAEARLVDAIVSGMSPNEAADNNGVSILTVRNQLRSIYRKMGVNRLTDVIILSKKL